MTLLGTAVFSAVCGSGQEDGNDTPSYEEAAADAVRAGLTPYWFGPALRVAGYELTGIEGVYPEGQAGVAVAGVEFAYFNRENTPGDFAVDVRTFQTADWDRIEALVADPPGVPSGTREAIDVNGMRGELIRLPLEGVPLNRLYAWLPAGDHVVLVTTGAEFDEHGMNVNPLIDDPELFLGLLELLQPYELSD